MPRLFCLFPHGTGEVYRDIETKYPFGRTAGRRLIELPYTTLLPVLPCLPHWPFAYLSDFTQKIPICPHLWHFCSAFFPNFTMLQIFRLNEKWKTHHFCRDRFPLAKITRNTDKPVTSHHMSVLIISTYYMKCVTNLELRRKQSDKSF